MTRVTTEMRRPHGLWSSSWIFVLAASTAAVGLNNFWQFPILAGEHGGAAFIVVYFIFVLLLAFPLMVAEVLIGRIGRKSPVYSLHLISLHFKSTPMWSLLGWLSIITCLLLLASLSVVGGWVIAYFVRSSVGVFSGLTESGVNSIFYQFAEDPEKQLFWLGFFVFMTTAVVARGLEGGLQPMIKYTAPALFTLLLVLLVYSIVYGDFVDAANYFLHPDFSKLKVEGIIKAFTHAFFSLGVGMGVMLMYGAFLKEEASIPRLSLYTAGIDTIVGVVAGLIIFSILFATGIEVGSHADLIFRKVPLALEEMRFGQVATAVFYAALLLVVWLSAVALIEPVMAFVVEHWEARRFNAAVYSGLVVWVLGIIMIMSFSAWKFTFSINLLGISQKLGFAGIVQVFTSSILIPGCAMLFSLYAGWVIHPSVSRDMLKFSSSCTFALWLWSIRVVIPVLLALVIYYNHKLFL
jgi:NSS family neurotransmitter:Na+ symporter